MRTTALLPTELAAARVAVDLEQLADSLALKLMEMKSQGARDMMVEQIRQIRASAEAAWPF